MKHRHRSRRMQITLDVLFVSCATVIGFTATVLGFYGVMGLIRGDF